MANGVAVLLAMCLVAPVGAAEPRILDSAAKLAAETRLERQPDEPCAKLDECSNEPRRRPAYRQTLGRTFWTLCAVAAAVVVVGVMFGGETPTPLPYDVQQRPPLNPLTPPNP